MDLLDNLRWRYATKKMDPTRVVPEEAVERILEAVRLAPTSSGLQPFELLLVTAPDVRARIQEAAWGQAQITEGSHLLVFAAWDTYTAERIDLMFDLVNAERGFKSEGWEAYRQKLLAEYPARSAEENFAHAARQAYIGLGFALAAAAVEGVDSTPMEGFDPEAVDDILGLRARGLRSVVLLPLGYRDEAGDWLVSLKKVRRARPGFVTEVR
ncbi:MAG: NAD(P)H-dependent oxidoreductase [Candidatus Sericytochromatia bacterium]|nr:NAD(P)H-dependent oxidoreductase [Candidatus Sericytochromatia bacterium]